MPTCAFSTYHLAQLVIDPAETLAPFLSPCLVFHRSTCRQALFVCRSIFGLVKCSLFLIRIRLLCASSRLHRLPALCRMPSASRVDLLFPLATTNIARAPGSSSVHWATSIATFCLCSRCHAQYSPRQLTKVVQKKQKG